jgi:hypothetical protein
MFLFPNFLLESVNNELNKFPFIRNMNNSEVKKLISEEAPEGSSKSILYIDDEYENLKAENISSLNKDQIVKSKTSLPQECYNVVLNIFFQRKNKPIKFIVETWRFLIKLNNKSNKNSYSFRKLTIVKKLSVLLRTILTTSKMLPLYGLSTKQGFDFSFTYELFTGEFSNLDNSKKINFNNYSDNIGSLSVEVDYINKNDVFKIEENIVNYKINFIDEKSC